jgi:hypothetical protein
MKTARAAPLGLIPGGSAMAFAPALANAADEAVAYQINPAHSGLIAAQGTFVVPAGHRLVAYRPQN